jgi:hypothetical protein
VAPVPGCQQHPTLPRQSGVGAFFIRLSALGQALCFCRRTAAFRCKRRDESEAPTAYASLPGFDNPTITAQESGTYGDKAKPPGVGALAALLFRSRPHNFDVDKRRRLRSCGWIMSRAFQRRTRYQLHAETGHQKFGGLSLRTCPPLAALLCIRMLASPSQSSCELWRGP